MSSTSLVVDCSFEPSLFFRFLAKFLRLRLCCGAILDSLEIIETLDCRYYVNRHICVFLCLYEVVDLSERQVVPDDDYVYLHPVRLQTKVYLQGSLLDSYCNHSMFLNVWLTLKTGNHFPVEPTVSLSKAKLRFLRVNSSTSRPNMVLIKPIFLWYGAWSPV